MWNFARTVNQHSSQNTATALVNLRQHLESLFPGKWFGDDYKQKTLLTGLPEIDQSLSRGLVRQRILNGLVPSRPARLPCCEPLSATGAHPGLTSPISIPKIGWLLPIGFS